MTPEKGFAEKKVSSSDGLERQPKLRFPGFTGDWEQRKFEDIAIRSSTISSESGLPRVEYEDIISGTGNLNKDVFAKGSNKTGIVFHKGDVLYGKLRPYLQNWLLPSFNGIAVGDFWVLQPQNADSNFLYRLIQSHRFDEVANQSTGTKMPRADWKLVSKTEFFIPSTIDEQALIGTYFEQFDNLITLHQRKIDSLKKYKRGLTNAIFRRELRFNADERKAPYPDWREVRFGDAFEYLSNNTLSRAELDECNGTIHNIHYGDILIKYGPCIDVKSSKIPFIKAGSPNQIQKMSLLRAGDIILADTAEDDTVGKAVEIVNVDGQKVVAGLHTIPCRPHTDWFAVGFLGYFINSSVFHNQLRPLMQGIKVSSISKSAIQDTIVLVPAMEEQLKIVSVLNSLEKKLTDAEITLEYLRQTKKGLLQQLFI